MNIKTTARHYQLTPALKEYAETKIQQLTRYFDNIVNAHIIFALEKYRHSVEASIHVNGKDFNSREESVDMYVSVDRVVEKLERQIQKYKGKRFSKKSPKLGEIGASLAPPEEEPAMERPTGSENEIVPVDPIEFPFLTQSEAVEKLTLDGKGYTIFSDKETRRVSVLFRRDDGTLGLIEA
jgi:putative sigma-54 modulation protein